MNGDRGQRYEVTATVRGRSEVVGWTGSIDIAHAMKKGALRDIHCSSAFIYDRVMKRYVA